MTGCDIAVLCLCVGELTPEILQACADMLDGAKIPEDVPIPIATVPAGLSLGPLELQRLLAAYKHIGRPLTAREAQGVIERGVLEVWEDEGGEITIEIGEAE